jgi:adenylate cyclase
MATWTCESCGGENPEGMHFCGYCGAKAATTWTCASCGGENQVGMKFCGHCGAQAAATPAPLATIEPATAPSASPEPEQDVAETLRSFVAGQVAEQLVEAGGYIPEERRLVTALFADVSGFTSLADRLDPEELLEVIDPVIAGLSSIVGRYEGYVEKFAGDALLALFGAPVTHEDDAARALMVALEMHAELERLCRELPHEADLTLHVGVNSGHGIARILGSEARMDYAVLGDSVILAQRLESAAPPGETYVSELTLKLTGGMFEFEPVGELTLKGKAEPVPAWRLVGRRQEPARRAAARDGRPAAPLVGRDRELAAIGEVLEALEHGRGGIVTITGEPGVGKSRLTEAARERAQELGLRWLETRCLSYGASLAYRPYLELVRTIAGIRSEDEAEQAKQRLRLALAEADAPKALPFLARLLALPDVSEEVRALEPEAFRRGLHAAFAAWLQALAQQTPLVLALEDVHWLDGSSAELTRELARLCAETPLALYLIARPEGEAALAELAGDAPRCTFALGPLDEDGVGSLVRSLLEGDVQRGLPALVRERTAGNPLFVEELLRSLTETGALARENGLWRTQPGWDAAAVPPTIEELLASRIDLLPRADASILQTASVIGRRVPIPLLQAVAPTPKLKGALGRLVTSGFLDPLEGDRLLIFHHALVQDVAYSRLLRRKRRDLHRKVADVAEAMYGSGEDVVDLLARHLYLGEAGAKAIDYLVRAGERARKLFANQEAILHLSRAAEVAATDSPTQERLTEIQLALADLHELVGDYDAALGLYYPVREANNALDAWRGIAAVLRKRGEYGQALAAVDAAFATEALRGEDLTALWIEQGWTLSSLGRFEEAIDVLEAGLVAAGPRRDPAIGQLLLRLARAESVEGRFDAAVQHALEAQAIFERHEDVRGLAGAMRVLGDAYRYLERLDDAAAALRRGLELAERVGSVEEIGGCLINLGMVEARRGALTEAIVCDRRAIAEFERVGHASGRVIGYSNLADKLARARQYDEAEEHCAKALELARAIGHSGTVAAVTDTMAMIELGRGNYAEAGIRADEAVALFLENGVLPGAAESLELAAEAWSKAGNDERARERRSRARSLTSRLG